MKKLFGVFVVLVMVVQLPVLAQATSGLKIGYANPQAILSYLPETKQIQSEMESFTKQLQSQYQTKVEEYQTKLDDFQNQMDVLTDVVKEDKQKELVNLQTSLQSFQQEAQTALQKKEQELLQPAFSKIEKAIKEVAEENGYAMILNSDPVLYGSPADNVNELVLAKLGVDMPENTSENN